MSRTISPGAILGGMVVGGGLGALAHVALGPTHPTLQAVITNVTEPAGIPLTFTATPNPVSVGTQQGLVTFSASAGGLGTGGTAISSYTWDFGNGQGTTTTASTTNHRYSAPGTYIATVTVRSTTGQQGFGQLTIRVNP